MVKTSSVTTSTPSPASSLSGKVSSSSSSISTMTVGSPSSSVSSTLPSSSYLSIPQPISTRPQSTQPSNGYPLSTQPPSVTSPVSVHITSPPVSFTLPIAIVLPGHITLSYTPVVQDVTKLVSSLESLLHGQNVKRAFTSVFPGTSEIMMHTSIAAAFTSATSFPADPIDDSGSDNGLPAVSSVFPIPISRDGSATGTETELVGSVRQPPLSKALYHPLHGHQHEYLHEQVRRGSEGSSAIDSAAAMASDQSTEDGADTDGDVSADNGAYAQSAVDAASSTIVQSSYDAGATDGDYSPTSTSTPRNILASQSPGSPALPAYPNSSFSNTTAVAATAPSVHHQHISIAEQFLPDWKLISNSWITLWMVIFFLV